MKIIWIVLIVCFCGCQKDDSFNLDNKLNTLLKRSDNKGLLPVERLKYIDETLKLLDSSENDSLKNIFYFKIANRYWNNENLSKFLSSSFKALNVSIKVQNIEAMAKSNEYIGDYYGHPLVANRDNAYKYYLTSKTLFLKRLLFKEGYCIQLKTAKILYLEGNYFASESQSLEALRFFEKNKDVNKQYECLGLLGIIYFELEDFRNALKYSSKALKLLNELSLNQTLPKAILLNNNGRICLELGEYNSASHYFMNALKFKDLRKVDPTLYSLLLENIAIVKSRKKLSDKSIEPLLKASIKINDSLKENQVPSRLSLSDFYLSIGNRIKAELVAQEALNISLKYKNPHEKLLSLKQLLLIGNKDRFLVHSYISITDSLNLAERNVRNKFARVLYETDKEVQQKDHAIKAKKIAAIISIFLLILATVIFIAIIQRAKAKRFYLIQKQQIMNEEIYRLMLDQQNKVEEARQMEKNRIARDLHDGIMNRLTSTRLNLFILNKQTDRKTIKSCLPFISGIQSIEREIRNISHNLSGDSLSAKGNFQLLIEELLANQKNIALFNYALEIDSKIYWENISTQKKIHIYRILQEAIQNTILHAKAKNIIVRFFNQKKFILMEIIDDGVGFNFKEVKKGIGIRNMKSRANEIPGKIEIQSEFKVGTKITLSIPI
jgi:signal transduction histidine kinase